MKKYIGSFLFLLIALAAFSLCGCGPSMVRGTSYADSDTYDVGNFTYNADEISSLEINWVVGNISVVQSDAPTLSVCENGTDLQDSQRLRYRIKDGTLRIEFWASGLSSAISSGQKSLTVEVPHGIALKINNENGTICADSLGTQSAELGTASGDIRIGSLTADAVSLSSASGQIDVQSASVSGDMNADTVSGNLHIDTLSARSAVLRSASGGIRTGSAVLTDSIQAGTVSGEVRIASLAATKAEVASESGDILLSLARCEEAEIDGDSSLITLTLLSDLGATVTHHSTTGSMQTGLLHSFSSEGCSVFGNGACRITVVTKSGDLRVR